MDHLIIYIIRRTDVLGHQGRRDGFIDEYGQSLLQRAAGAESCCRESDVQPDGIVAPRKQLCIAIPLHGRSGSNGTLPRNV